MHRVAFTQDDTGGHTVTYGPDTLAIDTDPGASTLVEIWPGGKVTYPGAAGGGGTVSSVDLTDSTPTGRSLVTAADAAAARTAIGVGAATATTAGLVELAATAEATTGTDTTRAVTPAGLKAVADTKANSSHTHTSADITDLTETVQDVVGSMVVGGTYDDTAGTVTLPSGGGGGGVPFPFTVAPAVGGYLPVFASGKHAGFACVAGRLSPCPVYAHEDMNVDAVALQVDTGVAGATVELALYTWGGGITSTLVAALGTVDVSSAGLKIATFTARPLAAGLHVVVARPSATVTLWGVTDGIMVRDAPPSGGANRFQFPYYGGGSMPATIGWDYTAGVSGNVFPKLQLRRSA